MLQTVMQVPAAVANHLVLDLSPAGERTFDEDLADRRRGKPREHGLRVPLLGLAQAATSPAQGEGGPYHERQRHPLAQGACLRKRSDGRRFRRRLTDRRQQVLELLTILSSSNRVQPRAKHANVVLLKNPRVIKRNRKVKSRLSPKRRKETIRPLRGDDALEHLSGQGLDIDRICRRIVGHDRRGVAVDKHHANPFFAQRAASLCPGVVELGGLSDDDGPGADHEHAVGFLVGAGFAIQSGMRGRITESSGEWGTGRRGEFA